MTPTSTTDEAYGAGGNLLLRYTGDSNSRSFVPFGGRTLAEYYCGGMIFDHPDETGSATTATDCTGNNVQERLYYPYGEFWTGANPYNLGMHQEFAQLPDYDPETDQYNTLARHYSPTGRWMSPDWSAKAEPVSYARVDDPQTLNLYAYVRNNPMGRVDPDGHIDCSGKNAQGIGCQLIAEWNALHASPPPPPPSIVQAGPGTPKWQYKQSTGDMTLKVDSV